MYTKKYYKYEGVKIKGHSQFKNVYLIFETRQKKEFFLLMLGVLTNYARNVVQES